MKLSDLKPGYIVETAFGTRYIVIGTTHGLLLKGPGTTWNGLDNYNEDMTNRAFSTMNIVAVYNIKSINDGHEYYDVALERKEGKFLELLWSKKLKTFDEVVAKDTWIKHPALDTYYHPSKALDLLNRKHYDIFEEMKKKIWEAQ